MFECYNLQKVTMFHIYIDYLILVFNQTHWKAHSHLCYYHNSTFRASLKNWSIMINNIIKVVSFYGINPSHFRLWRLLSGGVIKLAGSWMSKLSDSHIHLLGVPISSQLMNVTDEWTMDRLRHQITSIITCSQVVMAGQEIDFETFWLLNQIWLISDLTANEMNNCETCAA